MFRIGITDHLEGPRGRPSSEIFDDVADLVRLADELGVAYAWFAEHHAFAHYGHLPTPLLFALHLAGQTRRIQLGTAIICLNLHDPIDVAEQVAVADTLTGGRMAVGFGSGSTQEEALLFGRPQLDEGARHAQFEAALDIILRTWADSQTPPVPRPDLPARCWVAVNSEGAARIAGVMKFNVLFSHLRTPAQYGQYARAYRAAGGRGLVAANRPVFVAADDRTALRLAEPALRTLWRRFRSEGKIAADTPEPDSAQSLCGHPINFILGGPETVARQLRELHAEAPFDVANLEVRWAGLPHERVRESVQYLMTAVVPKL